MLDYYNEFKQNICFEVLIFYRNLFAIPKNTSDNVDVIAGNF